MPVTIVGGASARAGVAVGRGEAAMQWLPGGVAWERWVAGLN